MAGGSPYRCMGFCRERGGRPSLRPGPAREEASKKLQPQMHTDTRRWDMGHRIGEARQGRKRDPCRERPCRPGAQPRASAVDFACFAARRPASPGWARHATILGEGAASLMVHGVLPCMREAAARQLPVARCPSRCIGCCPRRRSSPRPSDAGRHSPPRTRPPPWQAFGCRLARVRPAKVRPRRVRHGQPVGPSLFRRFNGWRKRSPQGLACGAYRGSGPATRIRRRGGNRAERRSDGRGAEPAWAATPTPEPGPKHRVSFASQPALPRSP